MKKKVGYIILAVSVSLLLFSCGRKEGMPRTLSESLKGLDRAIAESHLVEDVKLERVADLKRSFYSIHSYRDRRDLCLEIIDEYVPYSLDSTLSWISVFRTLAAGRGERGDVLRSEIMLGEVMAKSGYYMESYQTLSEAIDPLELSRENLILYYRALFNLSENIEVNTLAENEKLHIHSKTAYVDSLLRMYPEGSGDWNAMRVQKLLCDGEFEEARRLNAVYMTSLDSDSHDYAKACYYESVLCDSLSLPSDKLRWEIASATADFKNAVKDYASLNLVSSDLEGIDLDRSFRYIWRAMDDAVFYNSKLRPLQVSHRLISIQAAYEARLSAANRRASTFKTGILLLAGLLLIGVLLLALLYRRTIRSNRKLAELNTLLQEANESISLSNSRLSESNRIKETYIGLFLSQLSENISKIKEIESNSIKMLRYGKGDALLKELLASTKVEEETDSFYETFDDTFLAMFPNFVTQFNDLLEEDSRIVLKKGEKLSPELRIFALIRLGVDDPAEIARLLNYSVRTIYNYKVKIRNASRIPKNEFEERVKEIG